jgi:hypothetical protein
MLADTIKSYPSRDTDMRRMALIFTLVAAAACSNPAGPNGPVINVTVRDDIGTPVGRTPVRVIMSTSRFEAATNRNGNAEIQLVGAGVYDVRVIPRDGYVAGVEPLTKTVSVEPSGSAAVDFTVHRSAVSTGEPPPWANPSGSDQGSR